MRSYIFAIAIFFPVFGLTGCFWQGEQAPAETPPVEAPIAAAEPVPEVVPAPSLESALDIVWKIPEEPVEEYVIRWGSEVNALTQSQRLKTSEIKTIEDSRYGKVFHYLLTGIRTDIPTFVTVGAIQSGVESPPSKIFKVSPVPPNGALQ